MKRLLSVLAMMLCCLLMLTACSAPASEHWQKMGIDGDGAFEAVTHNYAANVGKAREDVFAALSVKDEYEIETDEYSQNGKSFINSYCTARDEYLMVNDLPMEVFISFPSDMENNLGEICYVVNTQGTATEKDVRDINSLYDMLTGIYGAPDSPDMAGDAKKPEDMLAFPHDGANLAAAWIWSYEAGKAPIGPKDTPLRIQLTMGNTMPYPENASLSGMGRLSYSIQFDFTPDALSQTYMDVK